MRACDRSRAPAGPRSRSLPPTARPWRGPAGRWRPGSSKAAEQSRIRTRCGRPSSSATRATLDAAGPPPLIVAVTVTSQYMSVIPVDAKGMPTGPCVLWMDTRGADHNLTLLTDESFMLFVERHGLIPLPSGTDNIAHIHVLRDVPSRCVPVGGRVRGTDGLRQRPAHGPYRCNAVDRVRAAGVRQPHVGLDGVRPGAGRGDRARSRQAGAAAAHERHRRTGDGRCGCGAGNRRGNSRDHGDDRLDHIGHRVGRADCNAMGRSSSARRR